MIYMIDCLVRCQNKTEVNAVLRRFNHWLRIQHDYSVFWDDIYYVCCPKNRLIRYQFNSIVDAICYIHSVTFYNIECS